LIIALAIYATDAAVSTCTASETYCGADVKAYDVPGVVDGTVLNNYPKDLGCAAERTRLRDIVNSTNAVTTLTSGESYQAGKGRVLDMTPRVFCDSNILVSPSQSNYDGKIIYATPVRYDGAAVGVKKEVEEVEEVKDVELNSVLSTRGGGRVTFYGSKAIPGLVLTGTTNVFSLIGSVRDNSGIYHSTTIFYHASTDTTMTYYPYDACNYLKGYQGISSTNNWEFEQKVRTTSSYLTNWNDADPFYNGANHFGTLKCKVRLGALTNAYFNGASYQKGVASTTGYAYYLDWQKKTVLGITTTWRYYNNSGTASVTDMCKWGSYGSCLVSCPWNGCGYYTLTGSQTKTCLRGSSVIDIFINNSCSQYVYCSSGCNTGLFATGITGGNMVAGKREIQ
jgi:hypothetical protein